MSLPVGLVSPRWNDHTSERTGGRPSHNEDDDGERDNDVDDFSHGECVGRGTRDGGGRGAWYEVEGNGDGEQRRVGDGVRA